VHHPGHEDELLWAEWATHAGPLALGPVLHVDTAWPVDVPALAELVVLLGGDAPRPRSSTTGIGADEASSEHHNPRGAADVPADVPSGARDPAGQ
jgi:hypothetical protein